MARIGLTPDELVLATWSAGTPPAYAARLPGLNVLAGEVLALTGTGTSRLLERLSNILEDCLVVDGGVAAAGGALRIHAQQAARVGIRALAVSEPFAGLEPAARALAVADLAGLSGLKTPASQPLTTVVEIADPALAALAADRIVVTRSGEPTVAYPVVAPAPRRPADVHAVACRVTGRLPQAVA
jgi:hypothetical protein